MSDTSHQFQRHVASLLSDEMATTLYGNQEPHIRRTRMELKIRQRATDYLLHLYQQQENAVMSMAVIEPKLERLDDWIHNKLSGENMLALARTIESQMTDFVMYLPKFMGVRYEELKLARLWSALLNPESLARLTHSIRADSDLHADNDFYDDDIYIGNED